MTSLELGLLPAYTMYVQNEKFGNYHPTKSKEILHMYTVKCINIANME